MQNLFQASIMIRQKYLCHRYSDVIQLVKIVHKSRGQTAIKLRPKSGMISKNTRRQLQTLKLLFLWLNDDLYQYCIIIVNMIQKILEEERAKSTYCPHKLAAFIYGQSYYRDMRQTLEAGPVLDYTPNIYNKSRLDLIKDSFRYLPIVYNFYNHKVVKEHRPNDVYGSLVSPHQLPATAHYGMFIKYIELMCTDKQKELYLQKSIKYQIIGCYAQTELGHGSDIRSLETTAELDLVTKEWILNSPTISSAKYWPGELSFLANHAIVFAQTYIKGKNYGVHPFVLKIKDDDYNWLPGLEGGDIGPKIGYHAKENGYMFIRSVRVPKENLFTKYVQVTDDGEYKTVGDARIGYGTMMSIREIIGCILPKIYALPIIIGGRYSLFRKQFLNQNKQELTILEYQTQQDKIITRIAEYYAINIAGNKITIVGEKNGQRVLKSDFSLLQETHSNLSFSKALYSEIVHQGMQTIRRSIGGHGTSYYSGVPQIMNEYVANNTLQGQNTVLYLQSAMYVLKGYLGHITQGKPLNESIRYIARFSELQQTRFVGKNPWTLHEIRDLLVKTLNYLVSLIGSRIASKGENQTQADIVNHIMGIRMQQLAQLHGLHFTIDQFIIAIGQASQDIIPIVTDLAKLFIIPQLHRLAQPIIQGGFVCPVKWSLLNLQKEQLLKRLRPHTAILLDSFGIPEKYIRSELTHGNPYLNYLNRARECEINETVSDAAKNVGKIKDILAAKPRL